jgi:hypothetical protein
VIELTSAEAQLTDLIAPADLVDHADHVVAGAGPGPAVVMVNTVSFPRHHGGRLVTSGPFRMPSQRSAIVPGDLIAHAVLADPSAGRGDGQHRGRADREGLSSARFSMSRPFPTISVIGLNIVASTPISDLMVMVAIVAPPPLSRRPQLAAHADHDPRRPVKRKVACAGLPAVPAAHAGTRGIWALSGSNGRR